MLLAALLAAAQVALAAPRGPHSYANLDAFRVTHVDLSLTADFTWRQLRGVAILSVHRLDPQATHLVLDTRDLNISAVAQLTRHVLGATEKLAPFWVSRPFHLRLADPVNGSALVIDLPPSHASTLSIRIEYATARRAAGLHWTTARSGGRGPRIFYALSGSRGVRGWIPLQDTPRAPITLRVHVHTPAHMVALLSGARDLGVKSVALPTAKRAADHWLVITRPILPSRLDLVVGDLKFAAIGSTAGVYAAGWSARGPARDLRAAVAVQAAGDGLVGRSAAPRRDYVMMPADFPFAFVCAPRLSLLSPTLFGVQRRLVPLAARLPFADAEDLLMPARRSDRWIGQAFAAYLQSRIAEAQYGARSAAVLDTLDLLSLREALGSHGLAGASLGYDKGRLFLDFLAASFGRKDFDAFIKKYYARFSNHRVRSAQFEDFLTRHLLAHAPGAIRASDLAAWIQDPGLPQQAVLPDATALRAIDAARKDWLAGRTSAAGIHAGHWAAEDWIYFLRELPPRLGAAPLAALDAAYSPMRSGDAMRESLWLRLAIDNDYRPGVEAVQAYLRSTGRIDLIAPVYAALMRSKRDARLARHVYSLARPGYDPLAAALIDEIVNPRVGGGSK